MKTIQKPWHPPHTLIDKTPQELADLEEAGEISDKDVLGAKWRKAILGTALGAATADRSIQNYRRWKEQQKAAVETQTK